MTNTEPKTPGLRRGAMLAGALALLGGVAVAQGMLTPARRTGWWEESVVMNMAGRQQTMTMQMCTDPEIEKAFSVFSQGMAARQTCSQRSITPVPGGWQVASQCTGPYGARSTTGMITGDFQSHLHMDMVSKSTRGSDHMLMDMHWVGACPAGRRPGDVVMPGGMVMNMGAMVGAPH